MERNLTGGGVADKVPSNPSSPMLTRTHKAFYKFGARRHKHESAPSESTDPLLLSYKTCEGEALPEEGEDVVFDIMQDDKKKKHKKKNFLRKVGKLGRVQSNPIDSKGRSSDSDDKVQTSSNDSIGSWPYKNTSPRTAAKSMDDLSAIPETNTNNNNTTEHSPPVSTSPHKMWGLGKKSKEKKKLQAALRADQAQVVVKSAPSTPEKHCKKHSPMPNFNPNAWPSKGGC